MERDRGVIEVLTALAERRPRWGFWKLHDRLRLDGQGERTMAKQCCLLKDVTRTSARAAS